MRRGSFSGTQHKSRRQLWAAVPFAPNSAILRTFCVGTQITMKPPSVWFCTVSPLLFCCQERCLVIPIWNVRFHQQTLLMLMLRGAISLHRGLYDDTNLDQGPNLWRRVQHRPNDSGPLPRLWPLFRYGWGGRCKILNWMCWFEMDLLSKNEICPRGTDLAFLVHRPFANLHALICHRQFVTPQNPQPPQTLWPPQINFRDSLNRLHSTQKDCQRCHGVDSATFLAGTCKASWLCQAFHA